MADITMCMNGCEKKENCYRYKAPANEFWQAFSDFKPDENGTCKSYWPIAVDENNS